MIKEKMLSVVNHNLLKEVMVLQKKSSVPREEMITLHNDCIDATDSELTGGKGSSLCVLNCVRSVDVPGFFCVTTNVFKEMIRSNKILGFVEELEKLSEKWRNASDAEYLQIKDEFTKACESLRKQIVETEMSGKWKEKITESYYWLCESTGFEKNKLSVAVRSSATTEDRIDASFAGMHDTFLNQRGIDDVLLSIKKCWASVFTFRASEYRKDKKISHLEAHVSVVIQQMVFPKVSGTAFTVEIGTTYPGIHIASCFGLGEALVSGEVTSDEWLLHKDTLQIIKRVYGSKKVRYEIIEEEGKSGIQKKSFQEEEETEGEQISTGKKEFSLDEDMVLQIARTTKRIGQVYKQLFGYDYVDTEFAVSKKSKLYLLQCRPVVPDLREEIMTVKSSPQLNDQLILKGKYSLMGSVHGKAKVITNFQDLVDKKTSIESDDILITYKTANYWNQYLTNLRGIITMEGSPTAHPMLIGRERKIPCVIGCENVIELMEPFDGKWITLDGVKKSVFMGKLPLERISSDDLFKNQFDVVSKGGYVPTRQRLVSNGRARVFEDRDKEKLWIKNKLFKLCKLTQEFTQECYPKREEIIYDSCSQNEEILESRRKNLLKYMSHECVITEDNYVYDRYTTLADALGIFEGMGLQECLNIHTDYERTQDRVIELGEVFRTHHQQQNWNDFRNEYSKLIAHMWLSFCFRKHVNQKVRVLSNELFVSKFHLDQFQQHIQSQEIEEDNLCRKSILECSLLLLKFLKTKNNLRLDDIKIDMIDESEDLKKSLTKLGKNYKLTIIADLYMELPLDTCLEKAVSAIREFGSEEEAEKKITQILKAEERKHENNKKYFNEMDYFPQNEKNYCDWVKLGIQARILHCNAHHKRYRCQWGVRERLLEMKKELGVAEDIFWEFSNKDILVMIKEYNKKRK